jgi:hypothetical protein
MPPWRRSASEVELNVVSVVTLYDDNGDGMFDFDEFIKLVSDLLCLRDGVLFAPPQAGRNLAEVLAKQIPGPARPTIEVKHLVELDGRWASLIKQPDVVAAGGARLRSFSDQRLHGDLDELNARRLALIPPSTIAEYKRELTRLGVRLPTGKLTKYDYEVLWHRHTSGARRSATSPARRSTGPATGPPAASAASGRSSWPAPPAPNQNVPLSQQHPPAAFASAAAASVLQSSSQPRAQPPAPIPPAAGPWYGWRPSAAPAAPQRYDSEVPFPARASPAAAAAPPAPPLSRPAQSPARGRPDSGFSAPVATASASRAAPAVPATQLSQEQARAVRAVLAVMCAVLLWGVSPTTHAMYAFVRSRVLAFAPYVAGTVAALQLAQWRWRSSQEQARAVLAVMCAVLLWGVSPNTHAMYAFVCDFVLALAPYVAITIVAVFGAQLARWRWRATCWRANARWYVSSHGMLSFSLKVPRSRLCLAPLIRSADAGTSRSAATAGTSPAPAVGGRPSRASFGSPFGSMPFGSPAGQPANEAEALTKAKECDALRESLRKIADDFVAAPTEGAGVVDRRNLCGRYYTLAAAADAACGLRRASSDLPRLAWTDAFTGHEQPPTSSWGYELACALFNLAASLADLANGKPHKDAFKLYQQAAFTLDKLAEVSQQEGPWHGCEDLSGDTVSILSCLMLAQAQKALYLKIREENSAQPEMLEKLAAECASMFEEVSEQIRRTNKRPFRSFSSEWLAVIEANRLLLGGLAQQHAAKTHRINADAVFERVNEYGHQLARLAEGRRLTGAALETCRTHAPPIVHDHFGRLHASVEKEYAEAYREHLPDGPYWEYEPPPIDSLPPCKRIPAGGNAGRAKPVPPEELE